jgi:hypothetical protein
MRVALAAASLCLVTVLAPGTPTRAHAADANDIAKSIPLDVGQAVSGGSWEKDGKKGTYRAVLIAAPGATVQIFLQWIAAKEGGKELVSSIAVQAINDVKLPEAELSMDFVKANEAVIYVQPYDPNKDTDQSFTVTAGLPGEFKVEPGAAPE